MVGWGKKSYLGPAEIASFSSRDFCRSNRLFLRLIFINHCRFRFTFLEVYKRLGFHSSTVTFTVNSHTDNHFCKYIAFKYYTVFSFSFFIKIHVKVLTKVFYIQLCFKCETPLFFLLTIFHYILFTHGVTCNLSR